MGNITTIPKMSEGSFVNYQQLELELAYLDVMNELHESVTLIIPAPNGGDLATLKTRARHASGIDGEQWVASSALESWDTPPSTQGIATVLNANGDDEFVKGPTPSVPSYWTPISGGVDIAFSIGIWMNIHPDNTANQHWFSKDGNFQKRTWAVSNTSNNQMALSIFDDNASASVQHTNSVTLADSIWNFLIFTYDGQGGPDPGNGMSSFLNGGSNKTGPTGVETGTYVDMEEFDDEEVTLFARSGGANVPAEGSIWFSFYVLEDLAAGSGPQRIQNIYDRTKPFLLGIP